MTTTTATWEKRIAAARAEADAECAVLRDALEPLARIADVLGPDTIEHAALWDGRTERGRAALTIKDARNARQALSASPRAAAVMKAIETAQRYRQAALEGPADYEFDLFCDALAALNGERL